MENFWENYIELLKKETREITAEISLTEVLNKHKQAIEMGINARSLYGIYTIQFPDEKVKRFFITNKPNSTGNLKFEINKQLNNVLIGLYRRLLYDNNFSNLTEFGKLICKTLSLLPNKLTISRPSDLKQIEEISQLVNRKLIVGEEDKKYSHLNRCLELVVKHVIRPIYLKNNLGLKKENYYDLRDTTFIELVENLWDSMTETQQRDFVFKLFPEESKKVHPDRFIWLLNKVYV